MIVTTALRTTFALNQEAIKISKDLQIPFIPREKMSLTEIQSNHGDLILVGKNRLEIHFKDQTQPFFFHPNSSSFRVKRYLRDEGDPFIAAAQIVEGSSILDCTLGLASDSILASVVAGSSGSVVGIEANKYAAYLVKRGLSSWDSNVKEMVAAMQRIKVITSHHLQFLKEQLDDSFDIVYFDPMFETEVLSSHGINPIRHLAEYSDLTEETIEQAKRVAKQRVVLKDHWKSLRFKKHGFTVYTRPTSQFHYGTIELNK
ncbi:MAG: class I SAM-dependent methyltransferase [Bacillaceae bacterium]|nr:class I SAM-dependent methyltransferase [Bacillaceae bacterium]